MTSMNDIIEVCVYFLYAQGWSMLEAYGVINSMHVSTVEALYYEIGMHAMMN